MKLSKVLALFDEAVSNMGLSLICSLEFDGVLDVLGKLLVVRLISYFSLMFVGVAVHKFSLGVMLDNQCSFFISRAFDENTWTVIMSVGESRGERDRTVSQAVRGRWSVRSCSRLFDVFAVGSGF
jgi:hypothetical protein